MQALIGVQEKYYLNYELAADCEWALIRVSSLPTVRSVSSERVTVRVL